MANDKVLSEAEACKAIGLSEGTLRSFVESGYLKVQVGEDGSRCYSREELASVFGVGVEPQNVDKPLDETVREAVDTTEIIEEDEPRVSARIVEQEPAAEFAESGRVIDVDRLGKEPDSERLTRIVELQEKLLELKDREIEDLKEQRQWLRERVERLEEKSHRDQILMLSESQAIRELMIKEREKKSAMRSFIDWFVGKDDEKPNKQKLELAGQSDGVARESEGQNIPS